MQHLILPNLVQVVLQQGFEPVVRLRVLWSALVGRRLGKVSAPQSLLDGQLYVQAHTDEAAALLQDRSPQLLAQIEHQGLLPEFSGLVKLRMRVVVYGGSARAGLEPTADAVSMTAFSAANQRAQVKRKAPLPDRLHCALVGVEDAALRAQLERLLRLDLERRQDEEEGVDLRGAR
jgi:hypothetical protein